MQILSTINSQLASLRKAGPSYIIGLFITLLFMALWIYTARDKILDNANFKVQLGKSPMLTNLSPILAWAVPLAELLIVYLLLFTRTRLLGLYATIYLMVAFTTYIFITLNYSYYVPCKCGGFISSMEWSTHMLFNLGCTALAIAAMLLLQPKSRPSIYMKEAINPTVNVDNLSYG